MTDGYVGNDMQILDYIQKHRGRARMFPFGIGNSVNRFLIDGMARDGRGAPEYVSVDVNQGAQFGGPMPAGGVKGAKECAERFYRRIASPLLLDIHVDWNGLPVEDVYPKQIPDVFSSGPILLKGRYMRAAEGDVTIHGLLRGKPWSRTIHVSLPAVQQEGSEIATLWAREKIEDLQSQDWLGAQTNNPHPEIQQQIINTALEYHLMSQYTSFVAVEQRVVNIGGKQRLLDVPVELPEGVPPAMAPAPTSLGAARLGYGMSGGFGAMKRSGAAAQRGTYLYSLGAVPEGGAQRLTENERLGRPTAATGAGGIAGGRNKSEAASPKDEGKAGRVLKSGNGQGVGLGDAAAGAPSASAALSTSARRAKESQQLKLGKRVNPTDAAQQLSDNIELDGAIRPALLTPEQTRDNLEHAKLSPSLVAKLAAYRKAKGSKPVVVEIQVWVNSAAPDALAKLKKLGFTLEATLTPNRLLLGSIALDKLDGLLKLPFILGVETPKFK